MLCTLIRTILKTEIWRSIKYFWVLVASDQSFGDYHSHKKYDSREIFADRTLWISVQTRLRQVSRVTITNQKILMTNSYSSQNLRANKWAKGPVSSEKSNCVNIDELLVSHFVSHVFLVCRLMFLFLENILILTLVNNLNNLYF